MSRTERIKNRPTRFNELNSMAKKFYIVKEELQNLAFMGQNIIRQAQIVTYKNEEEMLEKEVFAEKKYIVTFYKEIEK